jgi:parallel beta-helix repeat protein
LNPRTMFVIVLLLSITIPYASLQVVTAVGDASASASPHTPFLKQYTAYYPVYITDNEDFVARGFSGSGTPGDPYVLEGKNITSSEDAVIISSTTAHFVIRDCFIRGGGGSAAVELDHVANGTISGNTISGAREGVMLVDSTNCTVSDCVVRGNVYGVSLIRADNMIIADSQIHHNNYGVYGVSGTQAYIANNSVFSNTERGILFDQLLTSSTVFSNSLGWNGGVSNILEIDNARDDGSTNTWRANRWSDYDGTGNYHLVGTAFSSDFFAVPLVDNVAPQVTEPDDIRYDEEDTGNSIEWNATDPYPGEYEVYINGLMVIQEPWYGNGIHMSVDGLTLGTHNVSILVIDAAGNEAVDSVYVTVMMSIFGGEGTVIVLYASVASVISIIFMLYCLKRLR